MPQKGSLREFLSSLNMQIAIHLPGGIADITIAPQKSAKALEVYLKEVTPLLASLPGSGKSIRESTLAVLKQLNAKDKREVVAFLYRNDLLENPPVVDLQEADLSKAKLDRMTLKGAYLSGLYLAQADFSGANLEGADLSGSDLFDVNFESARLNKANLSSAICRKARFSLAQLGDADLRKCMLAGADLSYAELAGVKLQEAFLGKVNRCFPAARLRGSTLSQAFLNNTNLFEVDMREADLTKADLAGADLRGADLSGAILVGAYLQRTDLRGANLHGADLHEAILIRTILSSARVMDEQLKNVRAFDQVAPPDIPLCMLLDQPGELWEIPYFWPLVDTSIPPESSTTRLLTRRLKGEGISAEQTFSNSIFANGKVVIDLSDHEQIDCMACLKIQYTVNLCDQPDYPAWV